ncbi:hypothetical protein D3C71_1405250 [compost metagenome]
MQDQVANGGVDQPHFQHLGHARTAVAHASMHHHREDYRSGGPDAVFGVLLQLAGRVQHARQIRNHITLGQAGTKQQDARERTVLHEHLLGALDLGGIGPGRQHLGGLYVVVQGVGHGLVHANALGRPMGQACVVYPFVEQAVHRLDAGPLRRVRRHIAFRPVAQDVGNGFVGQGVGVVLHARQGGVRYGGCAGIVLAHTLALAGAVQRW